VATSAACGLPIALVGMLTNMYAGWDNPLLPKGSWGFVYGPAFAGIAITSLLTAKVGVMLAHHLPGKILRRLFALLLLGVSALLFLKV
jgi:uncharacterized membrane protein YfcA